VGIVPYRLSEYTANVYPTKLNEYLAMGIPVVASDLAEIRRFNADHADVVTVAADAEQFAAGYSAGPSPAMFRARRRGGSLSRGPTAGSSRIDEMTDLIAHAAPRAPRMESGGTSACAARIGARAAARRKSSSASSSRICCCFRRRCSGCWRAR